MELEKFVKDFANQFDETDPESITAETVYKDLDEWSSLIAFTVIAMVKVEYDKTVTGAETRSRTCSTSSPPNRWAPGSEPSRTTSPRRR